MGFKVNILCLSWTTKTHKHYPKEIKEKIETWLLINNQLKLVCKDIKLAIHADSMNLRDLIFNSQVAAHLKNTSFHEVIIIADQLRRFIPVFKVGKFKHLTLRNNKSENYKNLALRVSNFVNILENKPIELILFPSCFANIRKLEQNIKRVIKQSSTKTCIVTCVIPEGYENIMDKCLVNYLENKRLYGIY